MRISKKALALFLTILMIANAVPFTATAANNSYGDVPPAHWAYDVIAKWSGDGYSVLEGDGAGNFNPSSGLSLGELATILSKTFGYTERVSAEVTPDWADIYVERAIAAGIIDKADKIDASIQVTREQAIKYIALAYNIEPVEGETTFADNSLIGAAYKPYVSTFQKLQYIAGKSGNLFDPQAVYTRSEAMQVIENTTSEIADKSVDGQNYAKNLILRKSGVTVKDTSIKENLIVGQGVGNGEVTLDNVTISGLLMIYGGGSNSVNVTSGKAVPSTVVNKPFGETVHLNGEFGTVTVTNGTNAIITGKVDKLIILGNSEVTLDGATVGTVEILGDNTKLIVNKGSTVENITVSANNVIISGDGVVKNVNVTEKAKSGVEVLTAPTKITVDAKAGAVKTKNNGMIQPDKTFTTSSTTAYSGGGGGGSGSSGNGGSTPTPDPSEPEVPSSLSLDASSSTLLLGEDSNELYFYLTCEVTSEASISLFEQSVNVAEMYDDGDFSLHGDDIAGDGIYSAKYINTAVEDTNLSFVADNGNEKSNIVEVKIFTPLSDETLQLFDEVDSAIEVILESSEFDDATEDERKQLVSDELSELSEAEKIITESILFNEDTGVFSFQYADETLGGVFIKDFGIEFNGVEDLNSSTSDDATLLEIIDEESIDVIGSEIPVNDDLSEMSDEGKIEVIDSETSAEGDLSEKSDEENTEVTDSEITSEDVLSGLSDEEKEKLWEDRANLEASTPTNLSVFNSILSDDNSVGSAIILNAFPAFESKPDKIEFRTTFYADLEQEWNLSGLDTTLDTDVTIDDFKNVGGYNIICISTHGSTYEWNDGFLWLNHHKFPAICLAEESTKEKDKKYSAEIKDKQIVKVNGSYWLLPAFFESAYNSTGLNESIVFLQPCESKGKSGNVDNSMSNALHSRSAEAVVGFHNSVESNYGRNIMKTYVNSLITGSTTQVAFDEAVSVNGQNHKIWCENQGKTYDNKTPVAYPILSGRTSASLFYEGIRNGEFKSASDVLFGIPGSWTREGDVRSISQLGDIKTQGLTNLRMAIITTGIGSKNTTAIGNGTEGSVLSQRFLVPADAESISFEYNFVSEEPTEYVGSKYDDSFGIQIKQGSAVVTEQRYESVNASEWLAVDGVNFADGDDTAYHTGWKNATVDVTEYRGSIIIFNFIVYDVGDSIYDSACLIDNVVIE